MTLNLEYCSGSNGATTVSENASYTNTLTCNEGYSFGGSGSMVIAERLYCTVKMGGTSITNSAFTKSGTTGVVSIAEVTGDVVITVAALHPTEEN